MKSDKIYLQHILEMISRIEKATGEGKGAFLGSELHQDAVLRNLPEFKLQVTKIFSDL